MLAQNMDDMAEKLAYRMRAEKELLANVSHELRTPLSRIKVALALCSDDESVSIEQMNQQLVGIESDVSDLERLIQDVMDVARYDLRQNNGDRSDFRLKRTPTNLVDLAAASRDRFETLGHSQSIIFIADKLLPDLEVDASLLKRVIDNLLENAAKYSPQDSVIELSIEGMDEGQQLRVSDKGIGISQEDLENVFDPFFRTDRSRTRGTGGTGLGLALCKRIVSAHGGTISANSSDTAGTEFLVVLPEQGSPT